MEIIRLNYKHTNCYLLKSSCGWIMIDTDWPDTLSQLLHSLKQQNIMLSDIKYLIVTHFHPDHAGLVQDLKDLGVRLILHENQIPSNHWLVIGQYEGEEGREKLENCIKSIQGGIAGIAFHDNLKGAYKEQLRQLGKKYNVPVFKHQLLRRPLDIPWNE